MLRDPRPRCRGSVEATTSTTRLRRPRSIPGHDAGAPLKPHRRARSGTRPGADPRPRCRGSVEADRATLRTRGTPAIPGHDAGAPLKPFSGRVLEIADVR